MARYVYAGTYKKNPNASGIEIAVMEISDASALERMKQHQAAQRSSLLDANEMDFLAVTEGYRNRFIEGYDYKNPYQPQGVPLNPADSRGATVAYKGVIPEDPQILLEQ